MLDFIAGGYLEARTKELAEKIAGAEAEAAVEWDERPVAFRDVPVLIANEADAVRRHELEQRYLHVLATMNPAREEQEKRVQREARGFGYPDYVALYDDVRALDIAGLSKTMQGFIADTDELYFSALDTYLSEMRILRDDAPQVRRSRASSARRPWISSFPASACCRRCTTRCATSGSSSRISRTCGSTPNLGH